MLYPGTRRSLVARSLSAGARAFYGGVIAQTERASRRWMPLICHYLCFWCEAWVAAAGHIELMAPQRASDVSQENQKLREFMPQVPRTPGA